MHVLNGDPPVLLPKSYRWLHNKDTQTVTVPRGDEPAPEDIHKLINYQCECESPCSSLNFGCNKAN